MRILIDIGHPGHVHLLKNFTLDMQKEGHEIFFTCRDKEFEIYLLEYYGFNYISFGKKYKSLWGKIFGLLKFDLQEILTAFKFKPDLFLSAGSMYAAHAAFFYRKPHFAFEDTFNMEQVKLYLPFTEAVFVSKSGEAPLPPKKMVKYAGFHELAYLHPNQFTPDPNIFQDLELAKDEKYIILRFVSWDASHDIGQSGISMAYKEEIIKTLSPYAKIFISAEGKLPENLQQYQLKVSPEKIHDVLASATLFIGEGATMASECAMLGTPAIYVNSLDALTIQDQEKYGLLFNYRTAENILEKALSLMEMDDLNKIFKEKQQKMLSDKIDVTAFLLWFVKHYPESMQTMHDNPNYDKRFH